MAACGGGDPCSEGGEKDVGEAEGGGGGNWWSSFVNMAKEKTASTMEMVRKDLGEFTQTAGEAVTSTSSAVAQISTNASHGKLPKAPLTFNLFKGLRSTVLEDDNQTQIIQVSGDDAKVKVYDIHTSRLMDLQMNQSTFTKDPAKTDDYTKWGEVFVIADKKSAISQLLAENKGVRGLYTALVPAETDHLRFWRRYFYKVHSLEEEERRRKALINRADTLQHETTEDWQEGEEWEDMAGSPTKTSASTASILSDSTIEDEVTKEECVETTLSDSRSSTPSPTSSGNAPGPAILEISTEERPSLPSKTEQSKLMHESSTATNLDTFTDDHVTNIDQSAVCLSPSPTSPGAPPQISPTDSLSISTYSVIQSQPGLSSNQSDGGSQPGLSSNQSDGGSQPGLSSNQSDGGSVSSPGSRLTPPALRPQGQTSGAEGQVGGEREGSGTGVRDTHTESSCSSSSHGESVASDEWEKDFNLSAAEMKMANEMAQDLKNVALTEPDWENWE